MTRRPSRNIHVVPVATPSGKRYVARQAGHAQPFTAPGTQAAAIAQAIPLAKLLKSEVVIHGRDGKIRDSDSYGSDPVPPRDKKH